MDPSSIRRAVPSDLRNRYTGKTVKHDLKTSDITKAAKLVEALNRRYETEWAGPRAAPESSPQALKVHAVALLGEYGLTPGAPSMQRTPLLTYFLIGWKTSCINTLRLTKTRMTTRHRPSISSSWFPVQPRSIQRLIGLPVINSPLCGCQFSKVKNHTSLLWRTKLTETIGQLLLFLIGKVNDTEHDLFSFVALH